MELKMVHCGNFTNIMQNVLKHIENLDIWRTKSANILLT